jgi:hypothetical protein
LPPWKSYQEVAQYLLNQIASEFGLGRVEGEQCVPGESGARWRIDAKGVLDSGDGIVIIECRRYPKSRLKQGRVAELAYIIKDTGAARGILVSPLPLQSGAKRVAKKKGIQDVRLDENCTTTNYVLQFLNQIFVAASARGSPTMEREVIRTDGSRERLP